MKHALLVVVLITFTNPLYSQKTKIDEYAGIDKKARLIPDSLTLATEGIANYINENFKTDKEKLRAIFIWLTANIEYDVENMFAIDFYESKEDKIRKPLKNRKGICENYAALFTDIAIKTGVPSFVIEGYTIQDSFVDFVPHAWCSAMVDSTWFMFDPTWGAGYIDGEEFVRKVNNRYFMVSPAVFIQTHMPFDFLWQFLNYPVTTQQFYEGKTQPDKSKPFFNYTDSIQIYLDQTNMEQLAAAVRRIEKNGVKNSLIFDRLQHLKWEIETEKQKTLVNYYNSAVADYNEGINNFNNFIQYRNNQFTPRRTDAEIQNMLDEVADNLSKAKEKLSNIKTPRPEALTMISQLTRSIEEADIQLKEQQEWLSVYFTKGKSGRKSMFYKYSWFGIPLN